MLVVAAVGNLGRDAEWRQAGKDGVCSFSVAVGKKTRDGEEATTWIRASIWGARGQKLMPHLTKGTKVAISGELTTREYQGKTYLECRVDQFTFAGGSKGSGRNSPPADDAGGGQRTGFDDGGGSSGGSDDEIPFAFAECSDQEAWWKL